MFSHWISETDWPKEITQCLRTWSYVGRRREMEQIELVE